MHASWFTKRKSHHHGCKVDTCLCQVKVAFFHYLAFSGVWLQSARARL